MQSVKRDRRKGEHEVKTESLNAFTRKCFLTRNMRNIINYGEWCITLLHVMLPFGRSQNCSHFYEFCQIFCPLNKHRRNKRDLGKIFKIQLFEVDINNNGICCNCYVKINKISWNKGK